MKNRVDLARDYILERILDGTFPPGSSLREVGLARSLNVSQATVREALHTLEYSGLISRERNVGTTVTRLTPKDLTERVTLRSLLEIRAAIEASQQMGPQEFAELDRRQKAADDLIPTSRYFEAAQADLDFHRFVWQCSGNQILARVLEQITVPLIAFVTIVRSSSLERLFNLRLSHEPLVEALKSRDPSRIEAAFKEGVEASYRDYTIATKKGQQAVAFGWLATP
ncbi:MAG: GntR family transcriptional regulator [Bryobacteraceae bacterium]